MSDQNIGHNRNLNKLRAAFVAIMAVFPLVIAIHMSTFLRADEYHLVLIPGGVGALVLWYAYRLWRNRPGLVPR